MKRFMLSLAVAVASTLAVAQTDGLQPRTPDFVKGADVGFLAGQERRGQKFHDRNGQERSTTEVVVDTLELLNRAEQRELPQGAPRIMVNEQASQPDQNDLPF